LTHGHDGSAPGGGPDLVAALRAWFSAHQRELPWRTTRDPYRVLLSEVMLQQTQVSRVIGAYHAFLDRFPTLQALAAAPTAAVVEQWRGLGYNRRAVNLQRAARAVVADHGGVMPSTLEELVALPGIGPYTARAVLVFAHEQPVAAVDVNVARVVQRAMSGVPVPARDRQRLADHLVARAPWEVAQALMELGARHCTARAPRCATCPVAAHCEWRGAGNPAPDPGAARRPTAAPFAGSDRFHRGRLLDALRGGSVATDELSDVTRTDDPARARRVAEALVADGLATWRGGRLTLPERDTEGLT
jgi:A/G-specific adenine glycosylase